MACSPEDNYNLTPIIKLNEAAIQTIRTLTGRYLVAIKDMPLNNDRPCNGWYTSRWELQSSTASCDAAVGSLGSKTVETFTSIIESIQGNYNADVRDATRWRKSCDEQDQQKTNLGYILTETGENGVACWRHVYKDHLNIYDLTGVSYNGNSIQNIVGNSAVWTFGNTDFDQQFGNMSPIGKLGDHGEIFFKQAVVPSEYID